jgi:hypothetical protein
MSTSKKKPESENPQMIKATRDGLVDTQGQRNSQLAKGNRSDQSEGAKEDGQTTARHGQGAGFSRNTH